MNMSKMLVIHIFSLSDANDGYGNVILFFDINLYDTALNAIDITFFIYI